MEHSFTNSTQLQGSRLKQEAIKAILSRAQHIPAPRTGTFEEFYGGWDGFIEHVRRSTGRQIVVVRGPKLPSEK